MKKGLCAAAKHNDSILLYMDLITYLQWIVIRQRKQELVMHSQLLQTDIRTQHTTYMYSGGAVVNRISQCS